jgi:hypothetical protein
MNRTAALIGLVAIAWLSGQAGMRGPAQAAEVRPQADEDCVMQCDRESDECMARAGDDEEKAKACDDRYTECLKKCR